jgi:hypothetical protein
MKKVRAKFQCHAITDTDYNEVVVHLNAVYSQEGENKDFTEATPAGNLDMHIDKNAPASKFFEQGKTYYLDFTVAE